MTADSNLPEHLSLRVGEDHTLDLPSLATAGYQWQAELNQLGVVAVSWSPGTPVDVPLPVGRSAPERLTLHAVTPGEVTLALCQRRAWERDRPPFRSHLILVSVS